VDALKTPSLLLAALIVHAATSALPRARADDAKIEDASRESDGVLHHHVESELQRGPTEIRVLLPDNPQPQRKYACLYLLPVEAGRDSRYGDGIQAARNADLPNRFQVICVMPTFSDLPWYCDHPSDAGLKQESYFLNTVIPFVERTYPVKPTPSGRLLAGFSKSGWGAFSLLLRHPGLFGRAAAWDAPLMSEKPDRFGMGPIFGTDENFQQYRLTSLIRKPLPQANSEPRLFHFGYDNFREDHQQFEMLLMACDIPHVFHDGPRRDHKWESGWLPEVVQCICHGLE
jgi:S-formylglutathione hydrolase FrmB